MEVKGNGTEGPEGGAGSPFVAASLTVVVALSLTLVTWRKAAFRQSRLPPGPKGWPVFGMILGVGDLPQQTFARWAKKYGPIMHFNFGSVPVLVVSSSTMAKEVLKTSDQIWASRPSYIIPTYLSYGRDMAYSEYGSHWRSVRKFCTLELFSTARVNQFQSARQAAIEETLGFILSSSKEGKALNMQHIISSLITIETTQMMWNRSHFLPQGDLASEEGSELPEILREIFFLIKVVNIADYIPALAPFAMNLLGLGKRMKDVYQRFDVFLESILNERETIRSEGAVHTDFLDVLLNSKQDNANGQGEEKLSRDTVKSILWDILVGGTSTTAPPVEWALAELIKHPSMMERVQDEISSLVGLNRSVTEADIPNLKYLHAVMKETLRMHPPGPLAIPHMSIQDCEIGGYTVPKGTVLFVNIWAIQRDPSVWENPLEFNPDRFLTSTRDVKGLDFELIPFGSGRRMCPAMNLGMNMAHFALANLVHSFSWSLVGTDDDQPKLRQELDMTEKAGPLTLLAKTRVPDHVIAPGLVPSKP